MQTQFLSAVELAATLRNGEMTSRELLEFFITRIEKYDRALNSIVVRDFERARTRADEADQARKHGNIWGALHGVPMTVKESFAVKGLATTRGEPKLKENIATQSMVAVDRLERAGAVIMGKTNVPWMLGDYQSFNAVYGTTNNPWDLARTPGGSSGGSAAALAAGLVGFEAGSDIAGSIRNPAHYCGVYGHKPTHNICPTTGHELGGRISVRDISVVGPMGRSAKDLEMGLSIMAGPEGIEARGLRLELPRSGKKELSEFKVAIVLDDKVAPVDQSVQSQVQKVADFLARKGAKVSHARPMVDSREASLVFLRLLRAASSGRLSDAQFQEAADYVRGIPRDIEDYRAIVTRADVMSHRDWHTANEQRNRMRVKWHEFFQDWDVLLCPAAVTAAVAHDQNPDRWSQTITVNDEALLASNLMFWAGYSATCHLPSTVAPIGISAEGLPIGVQIIGPQFGDLITIQFAELLEREYHRFIPPPGFD